MPVNPVQRGEAPVQPLNWRKGFDTLLKPQKKIVVRPNLTKCFSNSLKHSWLNVILVLLPVAWAVHFTHQSDTLIFVFSFLSIIPGGSITFTIFT